MVVSKNSVYCSTCIKNAKFTIKTEYMDFMIKVIVNNHTKICNNSVNMQLIKFYFFRL